MPAVDLTRQANRRSARPSFVVSNAMWIRTVLGYSVRQLLRSSGQMPDSADSRASFIIARIMSWSIRYPQDHCSSGSMVILVRAQVAGCGYLNAAPPLSALAVACIRVASAELQQLLPAFYEPELSSDCGSCQPMLNPPRAICSIVIFPF